ncbi:MAG: hypothetical protein ACRCSO_11500 [Sphingomonas sp.]
MANESGTVRVNYVCRRCTSAQVTRDGWLSWDVRRQRWGIAEMFDTAWCHQCNAQTSLIEHAASTRPPSPVRDVDAD